MNRQIEEILSWRFITEMCRRFPEIFRVVELHPAGGQADCLSLITKNDHPRSVIDVNRGGGSVHVFGNTSESDNDTILHTDWLERMASSHPEEFLDEVAREAGLHPPKTLPSSTPKTITYRYIADFLTHAIGHLSRWECRNGFLDTSGTSGGARTEWFQRFPDIKTSRDLRHTNPIKGEYAYNFWFLLKDGLPVICLDTTGKLYRPDRNPRDLVTLYRREKRIWAVIAATAIDCLP
jgi:hypothetical protein